ncbi:uncharacterized protein N7473_002534 [Penicillium subrubescens]|uniref:Leucine-rich repeat domain-containing protein n=1 Tax=Penicillium subrubescens TaxID=1316194 RepID=A0A1Q5UNY3_9EURO|nr:uncharacterized protein N7473_002534 [Penicillium subrubescens]KAJ5905618.1 hypothetical protein N7473_002534 [Penicillium subrubescens]OKP14180.1 hypothetical protein PENSUB_174 [Penicillium subrubescens]
MVNIQDLPVELLSRIIFFVAPLRGPLPPDFFKIPAQKHDNDANANANGDDVSKLNKDTDGINNKNEKGPLGVGFSTHYRDLRNLCLVSRRFRDVAQPSLFYNFEEQGLRGYLNETICFARALYLRPELGEHVRELDVMYPLDEERPIPPSEKDSALLINAIKELQLGDKEEAWLSGFKELDLSVLTALLVNRCPYVRGMFIPAAYVNMGPLDDLFDRNPSLLSELQSVTFEGEDTFLGVSIAPYQRLFTLPNLKEVILEYSALDDAAFPNAWTPGTVTAEKISFRRSHLDAGSLKKFMQACKKLISFSYKNFHVDDEEDDAYAFIKPEFNAPQLYDAILPHKDTLQNLSLTFAYDPWDLENLEEHLSRRGKLGSFRDFSALETVYIAHALLPAHPEFPPSLKKLHVADCESSIRDMVGRIAQDCKKGLYPNLTEFKVLAPDITQPVKLPGQIVPEGKTPEECFISLRDLFKETKVDFLIVPFQMWDLRNLMDYDDYEDEDIDFEDDLDLHEFGHQFAAGYGPPPAHILDTLARALGHPAPGYESDRSWVTEEEEEEEDDN